MNHSALWISALCLVAMQGEARAHGREPCPSIQRAGSAASRVSRIALPGGVELEYLEQGAPRGDVVIFLPGYTDTFHSFDRNLPLLARNHRVYALTMRGHGNSSKPATGYAQSDFAGDVIAFMNAKGIARATLVGHSMGSLIAHKVAAEHPLRVKKLVLIGSGATTVGNPVVAWLDETVAALTDPVDPDFVREFQSSTFWRPVPAWYLDTAVAESLKVPAAVWQEAAQGLMVEDHVAALSAIQAPTLLIWGTEDGFFARADQDELLARIPNARLKVYRDTGHAPHAEQPLQFLLDLHSFLR